MTTRARPTDKVELILDVARDIIRETGEFDLPMRSLASRAQVSLRTPYELFGSKRGLVSAILMADQRVFRDLSAQIASADTLDNIFDRVQFGTEFYAKEEPFYRALFRATDGYPDSRHEPTLDSLRSFQILTSRVRRDGFLDPATNVALIGEMLSHMFSSNLRTWALGTNDIRLTNFRIGYGFAAILASVATVDVRRRLAERMVLYDSMLAKDAVLPPVRLSKSDATGGPGRD